MIALLRRRPGLLPLLLLVPAITWLIGFYVYPAIQMLQASLWSGTLETGFAFSWANAVTYSTALGRYSDQFLRSILYAGVSTLLCLALAFPLAYTIAYTSYGVKAVLSPDVPNNEGVLRPITVTAPEGAMLPLVPAVAVIVNVLIAKLALIV